MIARISRIHQPVTVLGHGNRIGVWMQGCSIACKGCVSRDTWSASDGFTMDVTDLIAVVVEAVDRGLDGLTISGGEPFDQPVALHELLVGVRQRRGSLREFDVLVYSGRSLSIIRQDHSPILEHIDALIPEPFRAVDGPGDRWRGSANQPIIPLSALGRQRYSDDGSMDGQRAMQVSVEDGRVWMIGIPGPGDLRRVTDRVAGAGVGLSEVSWLP